MRIATIVIGLGILPGLFLTFTASGDEVAVNSADCKLSGPNLSLLEDGLASWLTVSEEELRLDKVAVPWMVLFDSHCTWHLEPGSPLPERFQEIDISLSFADKPIDVLAAPHGGKITFPSGGTHPADQGTAFASLADDETPFFALALLDVWRAQPMPVSEAEFAGILRGVVSHEIVHTLQIQTVAQRVEELDRQYTLPAHISDDLIEETFQDVPGYAEALAAESDLFYTAAEEQDPKRRLALIRQALALVDERHARYFVGENLGYREIDALFLNMEGVAVWAAYRIARRSSGKSSGTAVQGFERERNSWTQDEGFALQLLIDDLVPNWRQRMLGDELASPFVLLHEVAQTTPRDTATGDHTQGKTQ